VEKANFANIGLKESSYTLQFDENNTPSDQNVGGTCTVSLIVANKRSGRIVACIPIQSEKRGVAWSAQLAKNLNDLVPKLPDLNRFFISDGSGAHQSLLGVDFLLYINDEVFVGVPDPFHCLVNLLGLLVDGETVEVCGERIRIHH
jgi:hypothetical protein